MIGTLVQGSPTQRLANRALHVLSSAVSGSGVGWLLGAIGATVAPMALRPFLLLTVVLGYTAMQLGITRLPLPETGLQVPARWRYQFPSPVTAVLYGALLGPGIATRVASSMYMVVPAAAALYGGAGYGALILGIYAFVRAAAAGTLAAWVSEDPAVAMGWGYRHATVMHRVAVICGFWLAGALGIRLLTG